MSSFLLYAAAFAFAAGVFFRSFFIFGLTEILLILLVSFACALIGKRNSALPSGLYMLCGSLCLLLFALGCLRMEWAVWGETNPELEARIGSTITLEGTIVREIDMRENSLHAYVASDDELLLVTTNKDEVIAYGDMVTVKGTLQKPESFTTDLGRVFNYSGYLKARGVNYTLAFADAEVIQKGGGNSVIATLLSFKQAFTNRIEKIIPQPHVGLAEGLLLGVKQALGDELETVFRTAGIMHIVVLSGYNVMLVIVFVMYMLAYALPFRGRLWFGLIAILLFACMVGLSATVVRASIMAGLVLAAKLLGRTYTVVRALVITAALMILINPYLLAFDVGFQLSYIATLGLILLAPHVEKRVGFMPVDFGLREFLTATLATQLFVMPLLLYHIGEFSLVSVFVNVLVLPMVPVAMLLTFITGMIGFISLPLAVPFGYLAYLSLSYILAVATAFANVPFAAFVVPAFPFYGVVAAYACGALLLWRIVAVPNSVEVEVDELAKWTIVEESSLKVNR